MQIFLYPKHLNVQMEDVATQVQAARNESDDLRRQLAESEALVASVRGEQVSITFLLRADPKCFGHKSVVYSMKDFLHFSPAPFCVSYCLLRSI